MYEYCILCRLSHAHNIENSKLEEVKMAAEVITSFLPELVTAVSDCVQSVSDQCLAKGLIPDAVYKRVLESGATSEDKARTLVLAVKKSTETDKRCFELFMNIMEQELPYAVRDGLLEKMRREANEKASSCTAMVPLTGDLRQIPRGELARESAVQQTHLLGRLEEAVRQHEHARVEKIFLEEKLKVKTEKCAKLKAKFQALQSETQKLVTKEAAEAKSKIAACESEIEKLKERVKEVEKLITEQDMQVKRGRNSVALKRNELFARIAHWQESHATAWEKAREEMRMKEQETKMKEQEMSMREREYKVIIHEKDLRIRELEDEMKQLQTSDTPTEIPSDMLTSRDVSSLWKVKDSTGITKLDIGCTEDKWRKFGLELGFTSEEMAEITAEETKPFGFFTKFDDGELSPIGLLKRWTAWFPGDDRGTKTFATYSGLKTALMKAGLGNKIQHLLPYDEIKEEVKRVDHENEQFMNSQMGYGFM